MTLVLDPDIIITCVAILVVLVLPYRDLHQQHKCFHVQEGLL